MGERCVTLGVVGTGRVGKLHAENIISQLHEFQIKTVADVCLDREWAQRWGIGNLVSDPDEIFCDPQIDAVLICSPTSLHLTHIAAAVKNNKHIFCEKPLSFCPESIRSALKQVSQSDLILHVGFNRRWDPNFAKIKQTIDEGKIGTPHLLRITSRDPYLPPCNYLKNSGGLFMDMAIHDFDMARWLIGEEIEEIYALGSTLINPELKKYDDIDTAITQFRFKNGTLGVIDNSRQAVYGYDQRVEVFGSKGSIAAENNVPTNTSLSTQAGRQTENPLNFFLERYKDSYINELKDFHKAIVHKQRTMPLEDGLIPVMVAQAASQSLRENKPVGIVYENFKI